MKKRKKHKSYEQKTPVDNYVEKSLQKERKPNR